MALRLGDDVVEGGKLAILTVLGALVVMGLGYMFNIPVLQGTTLAALLGATIAGVMPKEIIPEQIRPKFSRETIGAPFFAGVMLVLAGYIAPTILATFPAAQPVAQAMSFTAQVAEAAAETTQGIDWANLLLELFFGAGVGYWTLFVGAMLEDMKK